MLARTLHAALAAGTVAAAATTGWAQLTVVSTSPPLNANNVPRDAPIVITFDRPVDPATFGSPNFKVFGKLRGPIAGTLAFSNGNQTVTFSHAGMRLLAGEVALVSLSHNVHAADGTPLRPGGYTVEFTARTLPTTGVFHHLMTFSGRDSSGGQTRIYGGVACDLNRDGWPDLTVVDEVSADLRVFLNRADHTGLFRPVLWPPTPIPGESSPNDVADFNNDGFIDLVTSSDGAGTIAIAMGRGDGTFNPPTVVSVGSIARGFGLCDADGDGWTDICVACAGPNAIAYLHNNGNGTFAAPTYFEGGVDGEYGMTAADMNNDGLLDLVVGGINSRTVAVLRGNGNGTFTLVSSRSMGGANWVIVCGDLNNDGKMDVSAANAPTANGSILLGNGDGTLQAPAVFPVAGSAVSTDLADIDGDGDLDWILSSFGAGEWYVYRNDGSGHFTADTQFPAPSNPSCCVPVDFDNDGDVDLILTDEIADVLVLMKNGCTADFDNDGVVTPSDIAVFVNLWFESLMLGTLTGDIDGNGAVQPADIASFVNTWFTTLAGGGC